MNAKMKAVFYEREVWFSDTWRLVSKLVKMANINCVLTLVTSYHSSKIFTWT